MWGPRLCSAYIATKGLIGQRVGVIGTARRSFEEVDSDTNELHIVDAEVALEKLEANHSLDATHENRYSLAAELILSLCADELDKSANQ